MTEIQSALFLLGAGLVAGAMNGLAGGGSFVSLPALIAAGVPSVNANASSTVALYPGGLASAWTYFERGDAKTPTLRRRVCGIGMRPLLAVTLVGGLAGSVLLLETPVSTFDLVLPWLLLFATVALAFGRRIGAALEGRLRAHPAGMLAIQFVLGVYGGYFGGAVGLMMLALWSLLGETDIKALNGQRTLLVSTANTIAVAAFILANAVRWPQTIALLIGGVAGGFIGARLGRGLPAGIVRAITLAIAVAITVAFFVRTYWRS